MKSTVFALIAIIAVTQATGVMDIFSEVANTEYGKNLVANIQIQLESGASVDSLVSTMNGVTDGLRDQFANAEDYHQGVRQACEDDMAELNEFLDQAHADHYEYENMGNLDSATMASRQAEFEKKSGELADRQAMAGSLADQRAAETASFQSLLLEYNQVFNVLASVRDILTTAFGGEESFLQTDMKMSVVNKLRNFTPHPKGISKAYNNFFQLMANILAQAQEVHTDTRIIDNIMLICDRIEENMELSLASQRHAEAERASDYEELAQKVQGQISWVEQALYTLASEIRTLESQVSASNDRVSAALATVESYNNRIGARAAECQESQTAWENYSTNIQAELQTCASVNYLLADQHARLARYGL